MHHLLVAASGAILLAVPATAIAQDQQYYQQSQQPGGILGQLLGAVFGQTPQASEQVFESDWNQGRRPFEQRRASLDARIDAAVRDGSLGRREADEMRREYDAIVRRESEYLANGSISPPQRSELRSRYRALAQRVGGQGYGADYAQRNDQDGGRWQMLSTRSTAFEQRINDRLRSRDLTRAEAVRLRADWRTLSQLEANYQRDGIDQREQADLWARYNIINDRLGDDGSDSPEGAMNRWSDVERRLAASEQNGRVTRNDAAQMRAQLGDLARLDAAYGVGGYSADQRAYLDRRHAELIQSLGSVARR
ncbi:MAG TPA: hypothetical protein VGT77_05010 [Sphingomonas sp.]|jgi:hypothetical protein|nr:hypothetical protein [Sphingomonas sp.]